MKNIAVFASGNGSNMEKIHEYLEAHPGVAQISLVLSNREDAYVLERARRLNIPNVSFNRYDLYQSPCILNILNKANIDFIVLAGFLWLIPDTIIRQYPKRIVNIHPALLPKFGGKGMFGNNVHEAVLAAKEKVSGITIHYVNEEYDSGDIILQKSCPVDENDTVESLSQKIHKLEYEYFPKVVFDLVSKL